MANLSRSQQRYTMGGTQAINSDRIKSTEFVASLIHVKQIGALSLEVSRGGKPGPLQQPGIQGVLARGLCAESLAQFSDV